MLLLIPTDLAEELLELPFHILYAIWWKHLCLIVRLNYGSGNGMSRLTHSGLLLSKLRNLFAVEVAV